MTSVAPTTSNKIPLGRIHKQRSTIPPIAAANYVGKTAETKLNRPSLTKQFLTCNEKSVGGTIEKGRLIKRAQGSLDKNEYKAWIVEDLKLKPYGAKLRVYISEHSILSDPKYWKHLPADYRTLYELSQIDDDNLLDYIKKGKVHHDLTRGKATQLKRDSWDDGESPDNNSSKVKKMPLPLPGVSEHLAVLLKITRYFCPDQVLKEYARQNPRPSELPSKEVSETALQWVEMQRARKSGARC